MDYSSSIGRSGGLGHHDSRVGRGYGSVVPTKAGLGDERPIYNKSIEKEEELDVDDELYVRDKIRKKLKSMIRPDDTTAYGLEPQRRDMNYFASPQLIGEKTHTTTARPDIAPFSHRQLYPKGMGPAISGGGSDSGGQIYRTTGNFRHIGSESGYVDPGTVMYGESEESLYDIRDIDDPMERAFKKHQKSIESLLNEINQYLRDN